jgi:hypothetical protein
MLLINHLVLLVFSNSFIIQSNSSSLQHRLLMDLFEFQSGRRPPTNALPTDLITKAFSCLPVKSLMRLRCMSKFYNSLISQSILHKNAPSSIFTTKSSTSNSLKTTTLPQFTFHRPYKPDTREQTL